MDIYETLKIEKDNHIKNRLYHHCQCDFAYNSNRIEGNQLTNDETRYLYETHTLLADTNKVIKSDDIIETLNHFKAFNYVIDVAKEPLNEEQIKNIHKILKTNTTDESLDWVNVGEYKAIPNIIGDMVETTDPEEVSLQMKTLIDNYNSLDNVREEDVIDFHYKFEMIHPFQDGNGRVGRLVMFKECLRNNIVPFIISDEIKAFYLRGLKNYKEDKAYLIDTCLSEQDRFKEWCRLLKVDEYNTDTVNEFEF